jgi:ribosome-binding factor A
MTRRVERLNHLFREEISDLIREELKDPRFSSTLISVTEVDLSPDLKQAKVYVSIFAEGEARQHIFQGLKAATNYLRRLLAQRVVLRSMPALLFVLDETLAKGASLTALIKEVSSQSAQPKADER